MASPNFVVIVTDDQGAWARGRLMPELVSPVLDELGATGLELENFFCASPVCSPARASLLTGRMPSAHGVHDWLRSENSGVSSVGKHYLDGLATTPEVLAANGYACGHSGKWHLGDARVPAPGFTRWYSHRDGGGHYFGAPMVEDGREHIEPAYVTDAITSRAVAMVEELARGTAPFYVQVHYTAPHTPWHAQEHPDELLDLYRDTDFPSIPREPTHPWFRRDDGELRAAQDDDPVSALRGYCAAISGVDRGVGQLLASLERAGRREDTYVLFLSDNGFSCGHHGYWGKGNGTWPTNLWDPSIRVPFIINRPGVVRPRLDAALTSAAALHPTILELAGVPTPHDSLAAGESFAARVTGACVDAGTVDGLVVYDEYGGTRMIRTRTHKLVVRREGPDELYDLVLDPGERDNLLGDPGNHEVESDLRGRLESWFTAHSTPDRDAFATPVQGFGQDQPVWAADVSERYVAAPGPATVPGRGLPATAAGRE
ncbi:MAG TPA: sulfatase-like hydrolase/transferase [Pedococcus sp.]|nr:sulfatase-like hydrolase/transferase [Pedococcus sp.]